MSRWRFATHRIAVRGLIAVALTVFAAGLAHAQVPSPANSNCPPAVLLSATGNSSCCFNVIVRDAANNPIPGSTVIIDLSACAPVLCPAQPPGIVVVLGGNGVSTTTNAAGVATFCVCGTFTGPCSANIFADGVLLCTVPVNNCAGGPPPPYDAWNHYKLYVATPLGPLNLPVTLNDEFGTYQHIVDHLQFWMNPVEKTVHDATGTATTYPIIDPTLHYTWWHINPQFNEKLVAAKNQFGDQTLYVKDGLFLLNPALKNQSGAPPIANHYKCYACEGQAINQVVTLRDQFDPPGTPGWTATVTFPRWFCNPADKQIPGRPPENQVDPTQHYVCYEYTQPDQAVHPLNFYDEFGPGSLDVTPSQWLCVPTIKLGFTPTTRSTWGKIKTLYR